MFYLWQEEADASLVIDDGEQDINDSDYTPAATPQPDKSKKKKKKREKSELVSSSTQ